MSQPSVWQNPPHRAFPRINFVNYNYAGDDPFSGTIPKSEFDDANPIMQGINVDGKLLKPRTCALRHPRRVNEFSIIDVTGESRRIMDTREESTELVPPAVGIIFVHGDKLWIDSTPVSDAVNYGLLKTHEKGHPDYWGGIAAQRFGPEGRRI